jgi:hypothetical protein
VFALRGKDGAELYYSSFWQASKKGSVPSLRRGSLLRTNRLMWLWHACSGLVTRSLERRLQFKLPHPPSIYQTYVRYLSCSGLVWTLLASGRAPLRIRRIRVQGSLIIMRNHSHYSSLTKADMPDEKILFTFAANQLDALKPVPGFNSLDT